MSADASEVARFARAAGAAAAVAASKSSASTGATMAAKETLILGAIASALAGATEAANAPTLLVWLTAACAGTLMGAAASAFAFANLDTRQRMARLAVSFCAGLLLAPYAAAHIPRPDAVPLVAHVFAASGLAAFVSWALVRAAQKRLTGIADGLVDRVAGKRKREKDEHEDGGP